MPVTRSYLVSLALNRLEELDRHGERWVLETLSGMTIMTRIACKNRLDVLLKILNRCSNNFECNKVLDADAYGNTCLHYFALRNNGAAYEELVSRGMSEHYRNKANETPRDVKITGSLSFVEGSSVVTFTPGNY